MAEDKPDRVPGSRPTPAGGDAKPSLWAIALFGVAVVVLTASVALILWTR